MAPRQCQWHADHQHDTCHIWSCRPYLSVYSNTRSPISATPLLPPVEADCNCFSRDCRRDNNTNLPSLRCRSFMRQSVARRCMRRLPRAIQRWLRAQRQCGTQLSTHWRMLSSRKLLPIPIWTSVCSHDPIVRYIRSVNGACQKCIHTLAHARARTHVYPMPLWHSDMPLRPLNCPLRNDRLTLRWTLSL